MWDWDDWDLELEEYNFQIGDDVEYGSHGATITKIVPGGYDTERFEIKFENTRLIPPVMFVKSSKLTLIKAVNKKECDCGAKHTSNPNYHAHWCSKSIV